MLKTCYAVLLSFVVSGTLNAEVVSFQLQELPQALLSDYRTYDLTVTGTGAFNIMAMKAELYAGDFFQHPSGGTVAPSNEMLELDPTLAFDTFVTMGGATSDTAQAIVIPGGAVNLGGEAALTFTNSLLDITWSRHQDAQLIDPTNYIVARLTVSNDAIGVVRLKGWTDGTNPGQEPDVHEFTIGPAVTVPETSTLTLASLLLAGFLTLHRRVSQSDDLSWRA